MKRMGTVVAILCALILGSCDLLKTKESMETTTKTEMSTDGDTPGPGRD